MASRAYDLAALRKRSVAERLRLVGDIWDTIAEEAPYAALPLTPKLKAEIDGRLVAHSRDASHAKPVDEVIRKVARRARPSKR
jgi:putative addiction module component (TIGR02574 family)